MSVPLQISLYIIAFQELGQMEWAWTVFALTADEAHHGLGVPDGQRDAFLQAALKEHGC